MNIVFYKFQIARVPKRQGADREGLLPYTHLQYIVKYYNLSF